MKKAFFILLVLVVMPFIMDVSIVPAQEISNAELLNELKALRERVKFLEKRVQELEGHSQAATQTGQGNKEAQDVHFHSVKGLADRVQRIEQEIKQKPILPEWTKRFHLSGLLEVEANYENMDYDDPGTKDEDSSDIVLATAELDVDVAIAKYVQGHIAFLWEEDDTEPVDIDEAFIMLDGGDSLPLYLNAGKMYVPFGYFESHFVSDPITLELGETNQSAVKVGFVNEWLEISGAFFNGDVDETGDDNQIDGFAGAVIVNIPEGMLPDLTINTGLSYISNIGDTDGLQKELPSTVRNHVEGLGAFFSMAYKERFFVELEYVGALDEFRAGELSFDGGKRAKPEAWNMEFAIQALDKLEVAFKYEGGNDLGDFQPESQYGVAVSYDLFENTSLSIEYLRGEFENDDQRDLFTGQLAVQF